MFEVCEYILVCLYIYVHIYIISMDVNFILFTYFDFCEKILRRGSNKSCCFRSCRTLRIAVFSNMLAYILISALQQTVVHYNGLTPSC
jgi:hypothetical protein